MTAPDIDLLAATAYETGIDPITYATVNVIEAHFVRYLASQGARLGDVDVSLIPPMTRQVLADLMDAGWKPPEVTR